MDTIGWALPFCILTHPLRPATPDAQVPTVQLYVSLPLCNTLMYLYANIPRNLHHIVTAILFYLQGATEQPMLQAQL